MGGMLPGGHASYQLTLRGSWKRQYFSYPEKSSKIKAALLLRIWSDQSVNFEKNGGGRYARHGCAGDLPVKDMALRTRVIEQFIQLGWKIRQDQTSFTRYLEKRYIILYMGAL